MHNIVGVNPKTLAALEKVSGMGTVTVERFGTEILSVLAEGNNSHVSIDDTVSQTQSASDANNSVVLDQECVQRLRAWRLEKSRALAQPAFCVCGNKVS